MANYEYAGPRQISSPNKAVQPNWAAQGITAALASALEKTKGDYEMKQKLAAETALENVKGEWGVKHMQAYAHAGDAAMRDTQAKMFQGEWQTIQLMPETNPKQIAAKRAKEAELIRKMPEAAKSFGLGENFVNAALNPQLIGGSGDQKIVPPPQSGAGLAGPYQPMQGDLMNRAGAAIQNIPKGIGDVYNTVAPMPNIMSMLGKLSTYNPEQPSAMDNTADPRVQYLMQQMQSMPSVDPSVIKMMAQNMGQQPPQQ